MMNNTIQGIIVFLFGCVVLFVSKQVAHRTAKFWGRVLHTHFNEKGYQIVFIMCGIAFIAIGVLAVFQILRFK